MSIATKKKANQIIEVNFDNHRPETESAFIASLDVSDAYKEMRSKIAKENASKRHTGSVQPLRTQEEITAVANYLLATGKYALRNWMIFIFGICTGLRCSDIICRQWKDVIDEYGNVKNEVRVTERKTGKRRTVSIDDRLYLALCEYVKAHKDKIEPEGYLFASNKKSTPHVCVDTVRKVLKEAIERSINDERRAYNESIKDNVVDENGNVRRPKALVIGGSHSMRKTFAYQQYQAANRHAEEMGMYGQTALTYTQTLLNHGSAKDTIRYLDLSRELNEQMNYVLSKDIKIPMPPAHLLAGATYFRM